MMYDYQNYIASGLSPGDEPSYETNRPRSLPLHWHDLSCIPAYWACTRILDIFVVDYTLERMNDNRPPLLLRVYTGRENGLMVVGDRASLKALGQQLITAAESEPISPQQDWPAEIASPKVAGPYSDTPDFALSFHLEGQRPASDLLPLQRRGVSPVLLVAVVVFSAVGLFTIARWVVANAL